MRTTTMTGVLVALTLLTLPAFGRVREFVVDQVGAPAKEQCMFHSAAFGGDEETVAKMFMTMESTKNIPEGTCLRVHRVNISKLTDMEARKVIRELDACLPLDAKYEGTTYEFLPKDLVARGDVFEPVFPTTEIQEKSMMLFKMAVCPMPETPTAHDIPATPEKEIETNPEIATRIAQAAKDADAENSHIPSVKPTQVRGSKNLHSEHHAEGHASHTPEGNQEHPAKHTTPVEENAENTEKKAEAEAAPVTDAKEEGKETEKPSGKRRLAKEDEEDKPKVWKRGMSLKPAIVFHVETRAVGPHGFLDGKRAGEMPFTFYVFVSLLAIGLIWAITLSSNKMNVFSHQKWITLLLGITFLEFTIRWVALFAENGDGRPSIMFETLAIFLNATRRAIARVLVLIVAYGWGVSRRHLANDEWAGILTAAVIYGVTIFTSGMNLVGTGGPDNGTQSMLITVETFFDCLFFMWTFNTLGKTVETLALGREDHKLGLMRWFTRIMFLLLVASFGLSIYEGEWMFNMTWRTRFEEYWFLMTGCWDSAYLATLLAILWLWRPTTRTAMYASYNEFKMDGENAMTNIEAGWGTGDEGPELGTGAEFMDSGRPITPEPPLASSAKFAIGSDTDYGEAGTETGGTTYKRTVKLP